VVDVEGLTVVERTVMMLESVVELVVEMKGKAVVVVG
jgi:hypothetical protein